MLTGLLMFIVDSPNQELRGLSKPFLTHKEQDSPLATRNLCGNGMVSLGQQLKFSRSFEEMKRHLEVQDETRHC